MNRFRVVLVGPKYAGNVGACARVCANYEAPDVRVVAPAGDWRGEEARRYAMGPAAESLAGMREEASLSSALSGCVAAVGFTRRSGALRSPTLTLAELASGSGLPAEGPVALVFGREVGGLNREELLACTHVCSLPTGEAMPALNLSHAVAVVLSRVFEASAATPRPGTVAAATIDEFEALVAHWRGAMVDAGMTTAGNPDRVLAHVRRALQRAGMSKREIAVFRGVLSKLQVAMGTRRR
jgi:tRNA (cytidine32/uridine32-2'-O)-methyltransferase